MRRWVPVLAGVAVLLVSRVEAKPCRDQSGFADAMKVVEAQVPCTNATSPAKYVADAKKVVPRSLSKACRKKFAARYLERSICGRSNAEVCCRTRKQGRASRIVPDGTCAQPCTTGARSVGAGCTPRGACATTTTAPTTTTTSTTTTTTLPPPPPNCGNGVLDAGETCDVGPGGGPGGGVCGTCSARCECLCGNGAVDAGEECDEGPGGGSAGGDCGTCTAGCGCLCGNGVVDADEECDAGPDGGPVEGACGNCTITCGCVPCPEGFCEGLLDFTTGMAGGTCGTVQDGSGGLLKPLICGALYLGGGAAIVPEGPTPDGSVSRFAISCTGSSCTLQPTTTAPGFDTPAPDCTNTGCNFGAPLEIPNPGIPAITTCVLNTWAAPASGTLDLATGASSTSVALASDVYLTSNLSQPCPRCSVTGSPASPGRGVCDRGPRSGLPCTTTSSIGLTRDCPTGGANPPAQPCTPDGSYCIDGSHVGVIGVDLSPLTTGRSSRPNAQGLFCPGQHQGVGPGQPGCFGLPQCRAITENGTPAGPITVGAPASGTLASVFCVAATGNGLVDASADLPGPGAVSLPGTFLIR